MTADRIVPTFTTKRVLRNSKLKSHIVLSSVVDRKILWSTQIKFEFRNSLTNVKVGQPPRLTLTLTDVQQTFGHWCRFASSAIVYCLLGAGAVNAFGCRYTSTTNWLSGKLGSDSATNVLPAFATLANPSVPCNKAFNSAPHAVFGSVSQLSSRGFRQRTTMPVKPALTGSCFISADQPVPLRLSRCHICQAKLCGSPPSMLASTVTWPVGLPFNAAWNANGFTMRFPVRWNARFIEPLSSNCDILSLKSSRAFILNLFV